MLAAMFVILFGAVYEIFSHGVYSYYMIYAFLFPLIGGALPFLVMARFDIRKIPDSFCRTIYHAAIATLTTGSLLNGVLEIYGTTNHLSVYYWYAGILLAVIAVVMHVVRLVRYNMAMKAYKKTSSDRPHRSEIQRSGLEVM